MNEESKRFYDEYKNRSVSDILHNCETEILTQQIEWDIGYYHGPRSLCITLTVNGHEYHYHDYGSSFIPRWLRMGWHASRLEREAKLAEYNKKLMDYVDKGLTT